jgi:hypothetical protein
MRDSSPRFAAAAAGGFAGFGGSSSDLARHLDVDVTADP